MNMNVNLCTHVKKGLRQAQEHVQQRGTTSPHDQTKSTNLRPQIHLDS